MRMEIGNQNARKVVWFMMVQHPEHAAASHESKRNLNLHQPELQANKQIWKQKRKHLEMCERVDKTCHENKQ